MADTSEGNSGHVSSPVSVLTDSFEEGATETSSTRRALHLLPDCRVAADHIRSEHDAILGRVGLAAVSKDICTARQGSVREP